MHPTQVTTWKRQAIDALTGVFSDKVRRAEDNQAEVKKLHAKIGTLAVENDFLSQGLKSYRQGIAQQCPERGLQAIYKGSNTSMKHPEHRISPYPLRKLPITRPNHVWCSDINYVPARRGVLYLIAIMNWATHNTLAWRLSNNETLSAIGPRTMVEWTPAFALRHWTKPSPNTLLVFASHTLSGNGQARDHEHGPEITLHGLRLVITLTDHTPRLKS